MLLRTNTATEEEFGLGPLGAGENTVMPRILIALAVCLLLAFIKFKSTQDKGMRPIPRFQQINLFGKRKLYTVLRGDRRPTRK